MPRSASRGGPGYAAVAVAFVVVSVGFALFASSYRSTLVVAQQQEAAFAVPADEVVSEDLAQLIPVRSVVTPPVERSLDARVSRVTRVAGSIAGADVTGITVLGLPRGTLAGIGGWRSDFASAGPRGARARRRPAAAGRAARPADPGRRAAAVAADGRPADAARARRLRGRAGRLVRPDSPGAQRGAAPAGASSRRVPAAARGGRLVAFRLEPPPKLEERGADSGAPAVGSVELGPPRVDGRPLTDYGDWLGTVGADRLTRGGALRFHVTLTNEVDTYLRPRQPTDGLQIPAVVSPFLATLAGPDRVLGVTVNGEQLRFRVAAVAQRFPGISQSETSDFLVVDRPALESALNTSAPGTGFATELWLDTDPSRREAVEARLRKPPFTALAVVLALAARALAARRAGRPRGARDAGDRGADGDRARAARARARHAQRAPRRGGGAVRPRGPGRRAREPAPAAAAARLAGGTGRRARRDR